MYWGVFPALGRDLTGVLGRVVHRVEVPGGPASREGAVEPPDAVDIAN